MSEFHRNLDGSFIYQRELGYVVSIIFEGEEENYSQGKGFSDNIWKRFTTNVYLIDFIFL
jgi:N-acetylneuraminic acid mutarotase